MSAALALKITHLTKIFRTPFSNKLTTALEDLSLAIPAGKTVALLGPNGSGKSTLLKIILALLSPTSGTVELFGIPSHKIEARQKIGFLPERPFFEPFLTIQETLSFYETLSGISKKDLREKCAELLELVKLDTVASTAVGHCSQGMLQRLGLAQALIHDPEFLILDEPTTGLDPVGIRFFCELILELKKKGKTILLTSHLLTQVEETCDHVAILKKGKLLYSEPLTKSQASRETSALEELYLNHIQKKMTFTAAKNRLLSKLAEADEVQGADGAQMLSV